MYYVKIQGHRLSVIK